MFQLQCIKAEVLCYQDTGPEAPQIGQDCVIIPLGLRVRELKLLAYSLSFAYKASKRVV